MKGNRPTDNNITDVIAPMVSITMELDIIIGALLKEKFGMSLADFKVLRAVLIMNVCTQSDIARFNQVSEAAVSKRVKLMINNGLIEKRVDIGDKRKTVLSLSTKGTVLMKRLQSAVVTQMESMLIEFPKLKRKQTTALLIEIIRMVIKHSPNKNMLLKSKHPILGKLGKCKN